MHPMRCYNYAWAVIAFSMVLFFTGYPIFSMVLEDFQYDKRTIVAGVGIEGPVKKLERENEGLLITTRRVELREAAKKAFPGKDFSNHNLEKLTKEVLGLDFVKPSQEDHLV